MTAVFSRRATTLGLAAALQPWGEAWCESKRPLPTRRSTEEEEALRMGALERAVDPRSFYQKTLSCRGVPVRSSAAVTDGALYVYCDRFKRMLRHCAPAVGANLAAAHLELHIIGEHEVPALYYPPRA